MRMRGFALLASSILLVSSLLGVYSTDLAVGNNELQSHDLLFTGNQSNNSTSDLALSFSNNGTLDWRYWDGGGLIESVNVFKTKMINDGSNDLAFCLSSDLTNVTIGQSLFELSSDSQIIIGVIQNDGNLSWTSVIAAPGVQKCREIYLSDDDKIILHFDTDGENFSISNNEFDIMGYEGAYGGSQSMLISYDLNGTNIEIVYEFPYSAVTEQVRGNDIAFSITSPFNHTLGSTFHSIPPNTNAQLYPYHRALYGLLDYESKNITWSKEVLPQGDYEYNVAALQVGGIATLNDTILFTGWYAAEQISIDSTNYSSSNCSSQGRPLEGWITVVSQNGSTINSASIISRENTSSSIHSVYPKAAYSNNNSGEYTIVLTKHCSGSTQCSFIFDNTNYSYPVPSSPNHQEIRYSLDPNNFTLTPDSLHGIGEHIIEYLSIKENGDMLAIIDLSGPINLTGETHSSTSYQLSQSHRAVAYYNNTSSSWIWSSMLMAGSISFPSNYLRIDSAIPFGENCALISGAYSSTNLSYHEFFVNNTAGKRNPAYFVFSNCPDRFDTDGDGYGDVDDAFPNDPSEWADSDSDGYGDNGDAFPNDPSEWADSDSDGYGDNGDAFPNDPSEWADSDSDGVGDNSDLCPSNDDSIDVDSDGIPDGCDSLIDNDGDGIANSEDQCEGYDDSIDVDSDGTPDGCDSLIESSNQSEEDICAVQDFDCDGLLDDDPDENDMDADGILDIIELSEGSGDVGTTNTEYLHELEISNTNSGIKIVLEFRVNEVSGYGTYVSQIMMFDENGNDTNPSNWLDDFNNSQMVRLEDALCTNPQGILGPSFNPILWLKNNITINGVATVASNVGCEWINKPSKVNGMDYPESIIDPHHAYLYDKKMRYTFEYNTASTGVLSVNIPNYIPYESVSKNRAMKYQIEGDSEQTPWFFWKNSISIEIVKEQSTEYPNPEPVDTVTPQYTSSWSIIFDVKQGPIDCSGSSASITEDINDLFQQNDLQYSGITSYQEYSIPNDDSVSISCTGSVEDFYDDDLEICIYLFYQGTLRDSECSSGSWVFAGVQSDNYVDIDDLESNFNDDIDDLFNTDETSSFNDDFGDSFLMLLIVAALLSAIIGVLKKQKETKAKRPRKKEIDFDADEISDYEYSELQNEFNVSNKQRHKEDNSTQQKTSNLTENTYSENKIEDKVVPEKGNHPPFDYIGEVNEDGWEICEYPRSSDKWWWKDYSNQTWEKWE